MGDEAPTIDDINRRNDYLRRCARDLSACLEAWRLFAESNPTADPNIARKGMDACAYAHLVETKKCGVERHHFTDSWKKPIEEVAGLVGIIGAFGVLSL